MSLEACPPLPPGVEPIEGLSVAWAKGRFGGLTLTLSTRPLACGEPAAQHGYCRALEDESTRGVTFGLPARQAVVGEHPLEYPLYVEFEAPGILVTGAGGKVKDKEASIEIFEITDTCVTGRIIGLAERGGPFDGGFTALRCDQ